MSVGLKFAWYDLWVGAFIERNHPDYRLIVYVCPLPCVLFSFRFAAGRVGQGGNTTMSAKEILALQQALAGLESAVRILDVMLREPAAEGLMSAEDYRSYVQGAWLGVDEAAEKAREALAGLDTPAGTIGGGTRKGES